MDIALLEAKLQEVQDYIAHIEDSTPSWLDDVNDEYVYSAQNLLRYLALRSLDIREIQSALVSFGISSLGTSAGYVQENISRSLGLLRLIQGSSLNIDLSRASFGYVASDELLKSRSIALFCSTKGVTRTKIMVTMPEEITDDSELVDQFLIA